MTALVIASNREKSPYPIPPVGAAMVAESLIGAGVNTRFLDICFSNNPQKEIEQELAQKPDWAAISFRNLDNVDSENPKTYVSELRLISRQIGKHGIPIVIGGPGAAIAPGEILRAAKARSVFLGSARAFADHLVRYGLPEGIVNGKTDKSDDYGGLARWIDFGRYLSYEKIVPIRFKKGCSFACSYCTYPAIEGHEITFDDSPGMEDYLRKWLKLGACVDIVDSVFNEPHDWAVAHCKKLQGMGLAGDYHVSSFTPKSVSRELLNAMASLGVSSAMIGIDSGSDSMLASYQKPFRMAHVHRLAELRKDFGFRFFWTFLIGGPGETTRSLADTMRFIEALPKTDVAYLTVGARIYPNTPLHGLAVDESAVDGDDPLLEPRFYLSKHLEWESSRNMLKQWARENDNVILSGQANSRFSHIALKLLSGLGMGAPSWKRIPAIKKWLRRFNAQDLVA